MVRCGMKNASGILTFWSTKSLSIRLDSPQQEVIDAFVPMSVVSVEFVYKGDKMLFRSRELTYESTSKELALEYPDRLYEHVQERGMRVNLPADAKLSVVLKNDLGMKKLETDVVDFSSTGFQMTSSSFLLPYPIRPDANSQVYVALKIGDRDIFCKAKLVRSFLKNGEKHYGCTLVGLRPEDKDFLYKQFGTASPT
jgi:hypothetical protein